MDYVTPFTLEKTERPEFVRKEESREED